MAYTTAVSVVSFSVVMAETFAAVAASTLIPAAFVAAARARRASAAGGGGGADPGLADPLVAKMPGVKEVVESLKAGALAIDEIDLLVPKTAKIHCEFEFEGSEEYRAAAQVGAMVQVVTVSAGYSALYQAASRNKITLDVEFATVNYRLD